MAQEFRYPLTRICLRNGALTLPRTMLGLFPEEGPILAVDTESGEEFELEVAGPRSVIGLGEFLALHELEVNDELLIRPLEDGRFGFTALPRPRKRDYTRPGAVAALLDELAQAELAANEAEIRALHPELPSDVDLRDLLQQDERFVYFEGRWQVRSALERHLDDDQTAAGARPRGEPAGEPPPLAGAASSEAEPGLEAVAAPQVEAEGAGEAESHPLEAGESQQEALWRSTWQAATGAQEAPAPAWEPLEAPPGGEAAVPPHEAANGDERMATPSVRERRKPRVVFPGDAALSREGAEEDDIADLQHVSHARELLEGFGFRVEALGQGDLMAHAELGRRGYTVLVHALGFGQRLDWAALLARRRELNARFLAVFGDRRDLGRLQSPAELARATLWSWEGLQRARTLGRSVPVSPFDLQLHFEREGLFDRGLERFEHDVAELVAERGAFSEVLTNLAGLRAPTVFLLEDLAGQGTLSRDAVLRVLERLVEAPFHLVARVAQGEFCLRRPVGEGLANLADYATSLRDRLPSRGRERLTGLGEPELLQEDELTFDDAEADAGGETAEVAAGATPEDDEPHA